MDKQSGKGRWKAAVPAALRDATDWFLPPIARAGDTDLLRRARLVVVFGWTLVALAGLYSAIFSAMGSPAGGGALATGGVSGIAALFVMRRTGSSCLVGNLLTAAFFATLTALAFRLGGHESYSLAWFAAVPVVALSTAGRRSAALWLAATALMLAVFYSLHVSGHSFPKDLNPRQYELLGLMSWIGLASLILSLALVYETAMGRTLADLRVTEDRLLRERDFSNAAIASLPGVFYLFDDRGKYLRWNENLEHVSGYSPEEIRGMHPLDFFRGRDREVIERRIRDVFTQGQTTVEAGFVTKDGTVIPYLFTGRRLVLDGKLHLIGMGVDIADRKRAETELARARDKAEAATRAKSEFLANMSHEIRTPMTAILGFSDILAASVADPGQLDAVNTIRKNGDYLLGIINDILDLSKIEAGKLEIERVPCSPCQLLSEVASLMRVRASEKGLPLEVAYDGPIPERIRSDPTRLRQVLINLIGNAVKFTESGKVRVTARLLAAAPGGPAMQFDVIDSGIGMTTEQIGELFKPFSQLDASTTRKHGGTGLGLTISKRLALELGGDIAVTSAPGVGSTFTLTVGTGPLDGVRMLAGPAEAQLPPDRHKRAAGPAARLDCRVLLAEDGRDNQRLIGHLLRKAGAEVTVVENGQAAVEAALAARDAGSPFEVVLMDMQMPVMDGYAAAAKLRDAGYQGPIIALTAHAMSTDRQRCLGAGCDDYMAKPIDRDGLVSLVAEYASRQTVSTASDGPAA